MATDLSNGLWKLRAEATAGDECAKAVLEHICELAAAKTQGEIDNRNLRNEMAEFGQRIFRQANLIADLRIELDALKSLLSEHEPRLQRALLRVAPGPCSGLGGCECDGDPDEGMAYVVSESSKLLREGA